MIENLNDINRVLLAILDLRPSATGGIQESVVVGHLQQTVVAGRNPDFYSVIEYASELTLIERRSGRLKVKSLGQALTDCNPDHLYELQEEQAAILVRTCYLDGCQKKRTKEVLKKFDQDNAGTSLIWSESDSEPFGELRWIADHLEQLGVFNRTSIGYAVANAFVPALSQALDEKGYWTEDELQKYLAEKKELGDLAEEYVTAFEQERLRAMGLRAEAECVRKISKTRVSAGFDVQSYDGASKKLHYDRFIEVKGSGKTSVRFVWSQNEQEKAAQLGDKYWIYFVGGIDREKGLVTREPVRLQNPTSLLKDTSKFIQRPNGLVVEAGIAGPQISPPRKFRIR